MIRVIEYIVIMVLSAVCLTAVCIGFSLLVLYTMIIGSKQAHVALNRWCHYLTQFNPFGKMINHTLRIALIICCIVLTTKAEVTAKERNSERYLESVNSWSTNSENFDMDMFADYKPNKPKILKNIWNPSKGKEKKLFGGFLKKMTT